MLCSRIEVRSSSDLKGFVAFVEALQEFGRVREARLFSSPVVEVVDSVVPEDSRGWHEVFVEVACLGIVPLSVVKLLIPHVNLEVDV